MWIKISISISIRWMIISVHVRVIIDGRPSTNTNRDTDEKCKRYKDDTNWYENEPSGIHAKNEILRGI